MFHVVSCSKTYFLRSNSETLLPTGLITVLPFLVKTMLPFLYTMPKILENCNEIHCSNGEFIYFNANNIRFWNSGVTFKYCITNYHNSAINWWNSCQTYVHIPSLSTCHTKHAVCIENRTRISFIRVRLYFRK